MLTTLMFATLALNPLDMRWTFGAHEPYTMYRRVGKNCTGGIEGNARWLGPWLNWWDASAPELMRELGLNWCHARFYKGMGWEIEKKDFPNVKRFVGNCHANGVHVLAYVQFATLYPEVMKKEIPNLEDWASIDAKGEKNTYWGGSYFRWMPCLTCDAWVEYLKKICTIAIREGKFDGIMFDNFFALPCYCKRCDRRFNEYLRTLPNRLERFGFEDLSDFVQPRVTKANKDPVVQAWCNWRTQTMTDVARRLYEHIKSVDPKAIVSANPSSYRRGNASVGGGLALDMYRLDRYLDLIVMQSANFPGLDVNGSGRITSRVRDLKMSQLRGKAVVALCDNDSRETPVTVRRYLLPLYEDAVFGGIPTDRTVMNPAREPGFIDSNRLAKRRPLLKAFNEYLAKNRPAFAAPSYQPVKLLYPADSIRFSGEVDRNLAAAEEILLRNRVPWGYAPAYADRAFVAPTDCELLIVPGTTSLSDNAIAGILDYAKRGGKLVVTGEAGRYDEFAAERFETPLVKELKKLKLAHVVLREQADSLKRASLDWAYVIDPPADGGKALMADIAASGWTFGGGGEAETFWKALAKLPPYVFAEYKRDGAHLYVHLLNYSPETPVDGIVFHRLRTFRR